MKNSFTAFAILLSVILSSCAWWKGSPASTDPASASSGPEVATTLPDNADPSADSGNGLTVSQDPSASEIGFEDNGKTFTFNVGDSFLLNLGADMYDWEVTIGDQAIVAIKMGVTQGQQGTFEALVPGTTVLTAVGNPKCLKSSPPCRIPTVLFRVTLVIE